jgi:hypothetical protein
MFGWGKTERITGYEINNVHFWTLLGGERTMLTPCTAAIIGEESSEFVRLDGIMLHATEVYFGVCLGQPTTHDEDFAN